MRLGSEHPEVPQTLNFQAELHWKQGHHEKAKLLYTRSLSICERVLGPEQQFTIAVRRDFDELLRTMNGVATEGLTEH